MKKSGMTRAALGVAALVLFGAGITVAIVFDSWLRYAGVALAVAGGAVAIICLLLPSKERLTTAKYARKKSIMSACEIEFLRTLRQIAGNRYEVLPQAALLSVIDKRTETSYRNELFRIVDYVFVDKNTFAPLLLVELNDRSHLREDRKLRDEKVKEICRKAKLPLVTFTTQQRNDTALVKREVLGNILKR